MIVDQHIITRRQDKQLIRLHLPRVEAEVLDHQVEENKAWKPQFWTVENVDPSYM
jgi:hypothetical protein